MINISVSTSPGSSFVLHVLEVDLELRLYQGTAEMFDAAKGSTPSNQPLSRGQPYVLRYNNNDGGPGRLHFQVVEHGPGGQAVRYTVNRSAIDGPNVIEYSFCLQTDASLQEP